MKKNIIVCGLIGGLIVATMMAVSTALCYSSENFEGSMVLGYAGMLLAFSLVFVGIKNYRDKYNQGLVSFWKACSIGLYITLIASSIYVAVWLVEYHFFFPDFMEKYSAHMLKNLADKGASAAEITEQTNEMAKMGTLYKNPFFRVLITYAEILPIGLLVTLISALLLKRKPTTIVK